jgi:hypothetical protein
MANHSELIGGVGDLARCKLKGDGSFDLDDRIQLVRGQMIADVRLPGKPPISAGGRRRSRRA